MSDVKGFGAEVTRTIWLDVDHIIMIYVGSAAEFPLVSENHWLFYTHALPSAPWDRFLDTFTFQQRIFRIPAEQVPGLAREIREIHNRVEWKRGEEEGGEPRIGNRAFLAVGAMLIDYGILAREYFLSRALPPEEKETYYQDQCQFYRWMGVSDLPETYVEYAGERKEVVRRDLKPNAYTQALFEAYRKELGAFRMLLLRQFMAWFVPKEISDALGLRKQRWFGPLFFLYPRLHRAGLTRPLRGLLFPKRVRSRLEALGAN